MATAPVATAPSPFEVSSLGAPQVVASAPMGPATNGHQGARDWISEANGAVLHPRSAVEVLTGLSEKVNKGVVTEYQPIPLGFSPLDRTLGGGIRSGS